MDAVAETQRWHLSSVWTRVTTAHGRAAMPLDVFKMLADYSHTLPSGAFIGKRWRRHAADAWYMGEYVEDADPTRIGIVWRPIDIVEGEPHPHSWPADDRHLAAHETARILTP